MTDSLCCEWNLVKEGVVITKNNISRYLAYKRDNNELLLFILRGLANETATYMRNRCPFRLPTSYLALCLALRSKVH